MRSVAEALEYAYGQHEGRINWHNLCLRFVRTCYGVPSKYPTAAQAWLNTKQRGAGRPARGALLWWTGGSDGAGHVALHADNDYCWSSDWGAEGYVGDGLIRLATLASISRTESLRYVGWTRDINGVTVVPEIHVGPTLVGWTFQLVYGKPREEAPAFYEKVRGKLKAALVDFVGEYGYDPRTAPGFFRKFLARRDIP